MEAFAGRGSHRNPATTIQEFWPARAADYVAPGDFALTNGLASCLSYERKSWCLNHWKLPWEGGCRCGAVRVTLPPLLTSACHCTGCQKVSASAFSLTLSIASDGFEVLQGETTIGGIHGPQIHHHHCDRCKSWVFTHVDGLDFLVNLRATMLDDHGWLAPFVEVFTVEKLPWAETGAVHSFETQPALEGYQALIAHYQARGAHP